MKNYLCKYSILFLSLILILSCSNDGIENLETDNNSIREEIYLLSDGRKITLEYNILQKEYIENDDLIEFENIMLSSDDTVIINDGSEVLRISTLEEQEELRSLKTLSNNQIPEPNSRVTLYDLSYNFGPRIDFYLNASNPEFRTVSLQTARCEYGVTPIDNGCQTDLYKKVSYMELYNNSYALMKYYFVLKGRNISRYMQFENPQSSSQTVTRFDLSEIGRDNSFVSVTKIRFAIPVY
ncbi:hypothetical protein GCM10022393_40610 [Aquimarina addita]|uniref:Uncharacterized protein n=1 Tax=Aquimarina addita TaxID=870485 RepID=A0ABP6UXK5_9FLAO